MDGRKYWSGWSWKTKAAIMVSLTVITGIVLGTVIYLTSWSSAQCLTDNDNLRSPFSVEGLLNGSTEFAINTFSHLATDARQSESNVVFSPFSLWSALLMTYLGSRGQTERELNEVLGLRNSSKADVGRAYKAVKYWYFLRSQHQENYSLSLVNSLFVEKTFNIRNCIEKYFDSEINRLDFVKTPEVARRKMNAWVEEHTGSLIKDLFPPGFISSGTLMSIVNAAYFKGKWQNQFKKENTRKLPFHVTAGRSIMVDMMHQNGAFYTGNSKELQSSLLEMPFVGEEVSMIFILPHQLPVDQVAKKLNGHLIRALRHNFVLHEAEVAVPKFRLEQSFEMVHLLTTLGVKDLFVSSKADLTGFSDDKRLAVNSVRHKAFLEINEEGGEAAAATGVLVWRSARPLLPVKFTVDRPFIFILHDNLSNAVLFMGVVSKPEVTNDV